MNLGRTDAGLAMAGYSGGDAYFSQDRPEMLPFIPNSVKRVLDVGCAMGYFGEAIKQARSAVVWGIESNPAIARVAVEKLDRVIVGSFAEGFPLDVEPFDCVVFNDVLEHMQDPWAAVATARELLAPGGVVVASIPNIRHFATLWALVFRDEWSYADRGILDRTHLRFFTKTSAVRMFEDAGFSVQTVQGINPQRQGRKFHLLNTLFHTWAKDTQYLQFAVVARR